MASGNSLDPPRTADGPCRPFPQFRPNAEVGNVLYAVPRPPPAMPFRVPPAMPFRVPPPSSPRDTKQRLVPLTFTNSFRKSPHNPLENSPPAEYSN